MAPSNHPAEGNVIYANFGQRKRVSSAEETGEHVMSARARNQPAMRLVNGAVRQTDLGRSTRGRKYANNGHVHNMHFDRARITASVAGSQNYPFEVSILLPFRSAAEVREAIGELACKPEALTLALKGDLPDSVLDVLLFQSPAELYFSCTCPDSAKVCKHVVAVAELASKQLDETPSLVFTLRDLTVAHLEQAVREEATTIAHESTIPGSEFFWSGHELPKLPNPKVAPMIDDSDKDLLQIAMQSISFTNIDQMRAVSDIEELYEDLTEE